VDAKETSPRRVIEVHKRVIGPVAPRVRNVVPRHLSDYRHVSAAHREVVAKLASPVRIGPPICDELVEFVEHLFTEEEASVARHLAFVVGTTAAAVARAEHRPVDQIEAILAPLCEEKHVIMTSGSETRKRYHLLPIMPGIFEMALIGESLDRLSDWHRRFAELIERLYQTGYVTDYTAASAHQPTAVRYLPVGGTIEAHPAALPSDSLEAILDRYDVFAVGQCQCRMTAAVAGHGCGRPLGNCLSMGEWAAMGVSAGRLKRIPKKDAMAVKREAESLGMVNFVMNIEATKGQVSCSCCGCCCYAMRTVNEFNVPSVFAPPHFVPSLDSTQCVSCGKCAKNCPMGALTVDMENKRWERSRVRCIGCGLCAVACDRQHAIRMEAVPDQKLPYRSWLSMLLRSTPRTVKTVWDVWRRR
jgi:Pyruvate/2-oxoacid:ferredoxin oxidoreductase delta subunit